jgi:hypothetical protein
MDISVVKVDTYEAPISCYGKTCRGRRCKIKTRNSYMCYGIEVPICKYHRHENIIYDWSYSRNQNPIPEKIKSFLNFYNHCVTNGIDRMLSVLVSAELHKTRMFISAEEIIQLFRNIIFTQTAGECSVCYDHYEDALKTRCGHVFCEQCLTQWTTTNVTCPMCRKIISQS